MINNNDAPNLNKVENIILSPTDQVLGNFNSSYLPPAGLQVEKSQVKKRDIDIEPIQFPTFRKKTPTTIEEFAMVFKNIQRKLERVLIVKKCGSFDKQTINIVEKNLMFELIKDFRDLKNSANLFIN
jgi:hypothetical protein